MYCYHSFPVHSVSLLLYRYMSRTLLKPFMTETKDEKAAKAPGLLFNRDYLINATSLRQNFMPSSSYPLLHSFFH